MEETGSGIRPNGFMRQISPILILAAATSGAIAWAAAGPSREW